MLSVSRVGGQCHMMCVRLMSVCACVCMITLILLQAELRFLLKHCAVTDVLWVYSEVRFGVL